MSMAFIRKGKSYKSRGRKNAFTWGRHIDAGNIVNPTIQGATKVFHQDLKSGGIFDDFYCLYIMGATPTADGINLIDVEKHRLVFPNDDISRHTNLGWTADSANGRYAKSMQLTSDIDLTHFGLHAFTMTAAKQPNPDPVTDMIAGSFSSAAGNSHSLSLSWSRTGARRGEVSQYPSPKIAFAAGGTTGTGLIEVFRVGNDVKLAAGGLQAGPTVVETATGTLDGSNFLYLGATSDLLAANYSVATIRLFGATKNTWTITKSGILKAAIDKYNASVALA